MRISRLSYIITSEMSEVLHRFVSGKSVVYYEPTILFNNLKDSVPYMTSFYSRTKLVLLVRVIAIYKYKAGRSLSRSIASIKPLFMLVI